MKELRIALAVLVLVALLGGGGWYMRLRRSAARMSISDTARRSGLDNMPPWGLWRKLARLDRIAAYVVAQVATRFPGSRVTSGFRSPAVNAAVGGIEGSKHLTADAFDVSSRQVPFVPAEAAPLAEAALRTLGVAGRVIVEGDHIHVEVN
jgi:zinc D-Ala-D-Ala carboxypeptidase